MFPRDTSMGGGEVAGIVVLLAVSESLGRLKREVCDTMVTAVGCVYIIDVSMQNVLESTNKTIVFTLFNGVSTSECRHCVCRFQLVDWVILGYHLTCIILFLYC